MKCAVWGGSGFIGSVLVTSLLRNSRNKVEIFDKRPSQGRSEICHLADIRDFDGQLNCDVLINLAAEHRDDVSPRDLYHSVNVDGAKNICKVAKKNDIRRIIFTSSVAVYGLAESGTDESGEIAPFNEYGRTKWEAEQIYRNWQAEDPKNRTLIIVRPTVVFGEGNRGNVFHLFNKIFSNRFVMIGDGENRKSLAYVQNVVAFIEYSLCFDPGVHTYNYVDKPDLSMVELVGHASKVMGRSPSMKLRLPYLIGLLIGILFDFAGRICRRKFSISAIRVKKFCADSVYESAVYNSGFVPPVGLIEALDKTIRYEFMEGHNDDPLPPSSSNRLDGGRFCWFGRNPPFFNRNRK